MCSPSISLTKPSTCKAKTNTITPSQDWKLYGIIECKCNVLSRISMTFYHQKCLSKKIIRRTNYRIFLNWGYLDLSPKGLWSSCTEGIWQRFVQILAKRKLFPFLKLKRKWQNIQDLQGQRRIGKTLSAFHHHIRSLAPSSMPAKRWQQKTCHLLCTLKIQVLFIAVIKRRKSTRANKEKCKSVVYTNLCNKVAHHTTIINTHSGTIGVENSSNADLTKVIFG